MNNNKNGLKNWPQAFSPPQVIADKMRDKDLRSEKLISWHMAVRCSQFIAAILFAVGLHSLALWSGDKTPLLTAFAATSALAYIGLAMRSRTGCQALLNLAAVFIIFAAAYAGMAIASEWLTVSFVLHGSMNAVQIESVDKDLNGALFTWSVLSSAMAILLLLG